MAGLKSTLYRHYKMQKGTENNMFSNYQMSTDRTKMKVLPTQDFRVVQYSNAILIQIPQHCCILITQWESLSILITLHRAISRWASWFKPRTWLLDIKLGLANCFSLSTFIIPPFLPSPLPPPCLLYPPPPPMVWHLKINYHCNYYYCFKWLCNLTEKLRANYSGISF